MEFTIICQQPVYETPFVGLMDKCIGAYPIGRPRAGELVMNPKEVVPAPKPCVMNGDNALGGKKRADSLPGVDVEIQVMRPIEECEIDRTEIYVLMAE